MKIDWRPLQEELERWPANQPLPIWWRDDDAIHVTPALDRLCEVSDLTGLPIHLAVIPSEANAPLATRLGADDRLIPLVHGWAHRNHASEGARKAEFGAHRPLDVMRAEVRQAYERLTDLLGSRPAPVFVPPWNRVAPDLLPLLPQAGYTAISTFGPRDDAMAAPGLAQINTHVDPIDWRGHRSLVAPERLITRTTAQLADRREGRADASEPLGLLTHHLVHDDAIWSFTQQFLQHMSRGPITSWTATGDSINEPT